MWIPVVLNDLPGSTFFLRRNFIYFCIQQTKWIMDVFFVAVFVTAVLFMAGALLARNIKYKALATVNREYGSAVLCACAFLMLCDMLAGARVIHRIPVDIMLALIPLSVLTNTLIDLSHKKKIVVVMLGLSVLLSLYYILCAVGVYEPFEPRLVGLVASSLGIVWMSIYVWAVGIRLWNIHALMGSGTVWTFLSLSVDSLYAIVLVSLIGLFSTLSSSAGASALILVLLVLMMAGLSARIAFDSVFAVFQRHERRIVESMRISPVESGPISPGQENLYKELYERIQTYFDEEKPFLNGNLTINDVVARVFSNKVYISRAICQCTGRNFCQYVNYHRVMYAMECFRNNTELKVAELWPLCGFNTIVSFNMAFRLFMNENPSDWCRKEKIRLSKKRK